MSVAMVQRASELARSYGWRALVHRAAVLSALRRERANGLDVGVDIDDVTHVDPSRPYVPQPIAHSGTLTINWVLRSVTASSGGVIGALRMVAFLESRGHTCRLYLVDPQRTVSTFAENRDELRTHFPEVRAELHPTPTAMAPAEACIATSYDTAYPVARHGGRALRFYLVQDYEPYFFPRGARATVAENTYRLNFFGLTLGPWLAELLAREHGMACGHFDFGADLSVYRAAEGARDGIVYYSRPSTERRGFELGILALRAFHERMPDVPIHLVGQNLPRLKPGFPFTGHAYLSHAELAALYGHCAAGLVLSFTNPSFLPLELLASGCVPVVNDCRQARMCHDVDGVVFAQPSPVELASALAETVLARRTTNVNPVLPQIPTWQDAGRQLEAHLLDRVTRGW